MDYMVLSTRRDADKAQDFVQTLQKVGPPMGMKVGRPNMIELPTDKNDVLLDAITSNLRPDSTQLVSVNWNSSVKLMHICSLGARVVLS